MGSPGMSSLVLVFFFVGAFGLVGLMGRRGEVLRVGVGIGRRIVGFLRFAGLGVSVVHDDRVTPERWSKPDYAGSAVREPVGSLHILRRCGVSVQLSTPSRRNHAICAATGHHRKEDTNMSTPEDDEAAEYRKDLSEVVDDIEERVAEKHRPESAPDTAAERTDTIPDDAGDEAPD